MRHTARRTRVHARGPGRRRPHRVFALLVLLLSVVGLWWAGSAAGLVPGAVPVPGTGQSPQDDDQTTAGPTGTAQEGPVGGGPDGDQQTGGRDSEEPGSGPEKETPRETLTLDPENLSPRASDPSWDPESIHVLVNPLNPLEPEDHEPSDLTTPDVRTTTEEPQQLRQEAAAALEELFAAIQEDGMELALTSAYRSHAHQTTIYRERVAEDGEETADEGVARPGFSEHQTGLAADVISIDNPDCIEGACFGETPEGRWVAEHAQEFGFIIRYPEGAEETTGYQYEPWHLRYVGEETALAVTAESTTLEEYWDQPAAPNYAEPAPEL